ncbi:hypothetical protein CDD81_5161 [Ophiocordyceps australis]|uniref:DUF1996 domain-containing protein n=1 Tax=Ophiocordyceps australis TaxID=1399860 RepID=A0A2C5Y9M1_9HYPO|nr:hypothetical protein CDD81_5161 [Ophiocordyceps australis]
MRFAAVTAAVAAVANGVSAAKDQRSFAVLRFNNKELTKTRADPIVNPGRPATHVHHVLGGSGFGLGSTGKELSRSRCSTALIKGDNSNYWFPSLYYRDDKTGKFEHVDVFYTNVYYFFEPTNDHIRAFPLGLSMLVGVPDTRSPPVGGAHSNLDPSKGPVNPLKWVCARRNGDAAGPSWPRHSDGHRAGMVDPANRGEGVGFPHVDCDGYASPLRADVHFPSCYNPRAGLNNYRSNMAFPTDSGRGKMDCPRGWIHVPHLFYEIYFDTPAFSHRWEQGKGHQPFVVSNGDATGYSFHADFMSGWDERLLQHIIDTCDAGTAGMDKCPGLSRGLNHGDSCTIKSPVNEKVNGVLTSLPGGAKVTGWGVEKHSKQPSEQDADDQNDDDGST